MSLGYASAVIRRITPGVLSTGLAEMLPFASRTAGRIMRHMSLMRVATAHASIGTATSS